jgi:hypothetical protein
MVSSQLLHSSAIKFVYENVWCRFIFLKTLEQRFGEEQNIIPKFSQILSVTIPNSSTMIPQFQSISKFGSENLFTHEICYLRRALACLSTDRFL